MIKPLRDLILVEPIRNSETNPGGVIFLNRAKTTFTTDPDAVEQITMGRILAVGKGERNKHGKIIPIEAEVGDIVTFSDTCGRKVVDGFHTYFFIREQDIAGFIDEDTEIVEVNYA
jgi:co-chaperonin GroES (HSP10)